MRFPGMQVITQESGDAYELTQPQSEQHLLQACRASSAGTAALTAEQLRRVLK
jgi:hypothetical protein